MISILTMAANALGGLILSALKAFFSLISWFLKGFSKAMKLFFCVLPITSVIFLGLFVVNIFLLVTKDTSALTSGIESAPAELKEEAGVLISRGSFVTGRMFEELFSWWNNSIYIYHGQPAYIFLFILTVLMFLPVVSVLLCISVFASFGILFFYGVCADAAVYVIRAVLGKGFVKQIQGRYFALFKEAGKKHDEKAYSKWLARHRDEFENDNFGKAPKRSKVDSFYDDDSYDDDDYDDEYEDEYYEDEYDEDDRYIEDKEYDDFYEDDEEYYEDEEYDEDYEDEDDEDYDEPQTPPLTRAKVFDFFASCNSRESLDKKYKSLVKLYHPDNMDGDTSALQEINVQYTEAKERF